MLSSSPFPAAYHKEPLIKLLSQLNVPQWNPPSGPSSLVSSVVFFRHGARTPVFISELIPPVELPRELVVGSADPSARAFKSPFAYRTQPLFELMGPVQDHPILGSSKMGELVRLGAAQLTALGCHLRERYSSQRSAWPAHAPAASAARHTNGPLETASSSKPSFLQSVGPDSLFCRSTCFARTLNSLLAVVTGLFDSPSKTSQELSKFALQVEVREPQSELLYPNPIITPSWERHSREGLEYALRAEGVRLDSGALLDRMKQYYGDEVAGGAVAKGAEMLRSKLKLMEADTTRFSNIHLFDEVNCRLELGVRQWSSERAEPLPNADFVQTLERSALVCQLHELLGAKVETEAELQAAVKLAGGHSVGVVRRLVMGAAKALQSSGSSEQPMDGDGVGDQRMEGDSASGSPVQWWGASNNPNPRLALFAVHDTTILPLLIAFGLFDLRWPKFGSSISVELYKSEGESIADPFFVRILYCWPRSSDGSIHIDTISERCLTLHDFLRRMQLYSTDES